MIAVTKTFKLSTDKGQEGETHLKSHLSPFSAFIATKTKSSAYPFLLHTFTSIRNGCYASSLLGRSSPDLTNAYS